MHWVHVLMWDGDCRTAPCHSDFESEDLALDRLGRRLKSRSRSLMFWLLPRFAAIEIFPTCHWCQLAYAGVDSLLSNIILRLRNLAVTLEPRTKVILVGLPKSG